MIREIFSKLLTNIGLSDSQELSGTEQSALNNILASIRNGDTEDNSILCAVKELENTPNIYWDVIKEAVDDTLRAGTGGEYKAMDFHRFVLLNTSGESPLAQDAFNAYKDLLILTGETGFSTLNEFRAFQNKSILTEIRVAPYPNLNP